MQPYKFKHFKTSLLKNSKSLLIKTEILSTVGSFKIQNKLNPFLFQEESTRPHSQSEQSKTKRQYLNNQCLESIHNLLGSSGRFGQFSTQCLSSRFQLAPIYTCHISWWPSLSTCISQMLGSLVATKLYFHQ